jgi:hypothetical protein
LINGVDLSFDALKNDSGSSIKKAMLRTVDCHIQSGMIDKNLSGYP